MSKFSAIFAFNTMFMLKILHIVQQSDEANVKFLSKTAQFPNYLRRTDEQMIFAGIYFVEEHLKLLEFAWFAASARNWNCINCVVDVFLANFKVMLTFERNILNNTHATIIMMVILTHDYNKNELYLKLFDDSAKDSPKKIKCIVCTLL